MEKLLIGTAKGFEKFHAEYISGDRFHNESYNVLSHEWNTLANKENLTAREKQQLARDYNQAFWDFGNNCKNYLDKKYGNEDGKLTMDEYIKSEESILPKDFKGEKEKYIEGTMNTFKNIDLDNSGDIDSREMTALMVMFDKDVETGKKNGKITLYDMISYYSRLIQDAGSEFGKNIKNELKSVYDSLFQPKK